MRGGGRKVVEFLAKQNRRWLLLKAANFEAGTGGRRADGGQTLRSCLEA